MRLLTLLFYVVFFCSSAVAQSGAFEIPPRMAGRVQFWVDIFAKYGKYTSVVHHRDYPQVVFEVLDFSEKAQVLPPIAMEKYKKGVEKEYVRALKAAITNLARGQGPTTPFERQIEERMRGISGGAERYREILKDDLIRTQTGIADRFKEAVIRSGRYLPSLERIFAEYGLPIELTRLPFVESSFDYKAYSSVGAAGIWQFMPRTGKLYGLRQTKAIDERRDPIEATRAAARYLRDAYQSLGTWPLAITSYNHGQYGVMKAVRKMGTRDIASIVEYAGDRVFGFASNNFYPEFLAALVVYNNRFKYFPGVQIEPPLEFDQIKLSQPASVQHICRVLQVEIGDLLPLNYAIFDRTWRGQLQLPTGYVLKVPPGVGLRAGRLGQEPERVAPARVVSEPKMPPASAVHGGASYKVRKGDTLGAIAKRYKTSVAEIKRLNGLKSNNLRIGQVLIVHGAAGHASKEERVAPKSTPQPERSPEVYKVKRGDSLWSISRRFGVSLEDLKRRNNLSRGELMPGDVVIIP